MRVPPAGDPETNSVQEILGFQTHTIRMMYGLIGDALKAKGSTDHPRDYLNFFCLGNRETKSVSALPAWRLDVLGTKLVLMSREELCCCLRAWTGSCQTAHHALVYACRRPDDPVPQQLAPATSYAARAYAQRRFLIYVWHYVRLSTACWRPRCTVNGIIFQAAVP